MLQKIKKLMRDKKGDVIMIFIAFLILLFGMMTIFYSKTVQLVVSRVKLDNALAEAGQKIKQQCAQAFYGPADEDHPFDLRNLYFDTDYAKQIALNTLLNHGFEPQQLTVTLQGYEFKITGRALVPGLYLEKYIPTAIPFDYSVRIHKNY